MLPIFLQELFSAFRLFNFCVKKNGENAAHFSARIFCRFLTFAFPVNYRGRCCPFFCKSFLQKFRLYNFLLKNGKMLHIVSGDGRRCNAFRLNQPDYATFSRETRGRNALQRVSLANFPGKRSIIWLLQTKRVATLSVCRNNVFLETAGVATRFV